MGLGLGLTGIVVTTVGMMTAGVASAFPCPAVNQGLGARRDAARARAHRAVLSFTRAVGSPA
jgi:hypothetical protein